MIVCLCRGVSDRAIVAAIRDGAETADEVGQACGAGTSCGSCKPTIERMCARACADCPRREVGEAASPADAASQAA